MAHRNLSKSAHLVASDRHIAQHRNTIGEWRMSAEHAREKFSRGQRLHDAQRRSRLRDIHRNSLVVGSELFKRANQAIRVPDHLHARSICLIFALTRNAHLQNQRAEWRKKQRKQGSQTSTATVTASATVPAK